MPALNRTGGRCGEAGRQQWRAEAPQRAVLHAERRGDHTAVSAPAGAVQDATGNGLDLACGDQGCTGKWAGANTRGAQLEAVKPPDAKRGFVLPPRRRVVERPFAWVARCRRLARDYERLPETTTGLHRVAFACIMLRRAADLAMVHDSL